jgi:hypothetical protein
MKNKIKLTNKDGVPVENVGELLELLAPFREETKITPLHLFYIPMNGGKSARLEIKITNQSVQPTEVPAAHFKR